MVIDKGDDIMKIRLSIKRSAWIILSILVVLSLGAACTPDLAYWRAIDQTLNALGVSDRTTAAKLLPADTGLYVNLSVNLPALTGYQGLADIYHGAVDINQVVADLQASAEKDLEINLNQDVLPWFGGEVALASSDVSQLVKGDNGNIVMTVATRDAAAADAFLGKLREKQSSTDGQTFARRQYRGVTYWVQTGSSSPGSSVCMAIVDKFVVLASLEKDLLGVIDRATTGGESLASNSSFQAVMGALPKNPPLSFYLDYAAIAQLITESQGSSLSGPSVTPDELSQLAALQAVGLAATLLPDALQLDTAAQLDLAKLPAEARKSYEQPANPNAVLKRIPADALFFINNRDLRALWQQVRSVLAANPDFERQLTDMQEQTGINLDSDVFGWMTGEFAMVLTKAQAAGPGMPPLGGYMLIGSQDPKSAQQKVDKILKQLGPMAAGSLKPQTVNGHQLQVINDPANPELLAGFGFWDNYFIAGYSQEAFKAAFSASGNPVTNNRNFKQLAARLPAANQGYFFVDLGALWRLLDATPELGSDIQYASLRPFLQPVRALGVAGGVSKDGIQTGRLVLLMAKQ
jgi:hypothetical protein